MSDVLKSRPIIYVFTTAYDPFIGGAEIAIAEVIKKLSSDFDFIIVTARLKKDLTPFEEKNKINPPTFSRGIREGGWIKIIRIGIGSRFDKYLLPIVGPFVVRRWMQTYPAALSWAVMVSFASGIPYLLNILRPWKKIPIVLTLQEGDSESHLKKSRVGLINISWRFALRGCGALTVISRYLADLSRTFGYGGPVSVIPNGVDIARFGAPMPDQEKENLRRSLGLADNSRVVITTSRLVYKNGVDTLIDSLLYLPRVMREHVRLLIIGGGADEQALKERVVNKGLSSLVLFLGEKPHSELPQYLHLGDVFVRASRSEGMGNSFIEAMAAGVPVVGTNVGGIPDFLIDQKTGLMVESNDPKALAIAIETMLSDAELRRNVTGQAARLVHESYDWKRIAGSYAGVFKAACRRADLPRILIANGIYPPDIGGSGKYAQTLAALFRGRGFQVQVLTYGETKNRDNIVSVARTWPTGVRHIAAFLKALPRVAKSDVVLLFDHFSMGLPVALAAWILHRPVILRVGGDFLWESYVESRRAELSLPDFYQKKFTLNLKERIIFVAARFVLQRAVRVLFSTEWQRRIFMDAYGLAKEQTSVVGNAVSVHQAKRSRKKVAGTDEELIYAGRFIFLKNLRRLLLVFREFRLAEGAKWTLALIGEGPEEHELRGLIHSYGMEEYAVIEPPLPRAALDGRIQSARAVIIPSLSDVSPNLVLEALALRTPAVLTVHSGYTFDASQGVLRIDPLSNDSLRQALGLLEYKDSYRALKAAITNIQPSPSFDEAADRYQQLIREFC